MPAARSIGAPVLSTRPSSAGAGVGACLVLILVAGLAEMPRRDWQRILVRVLGSWCAAAAALVLALSIYTAAFIAEIVRAGIQSLENGQWEASCALGLTYRQQMWDIILPQALKRVLPPLANEFINTLKYSAIVSVISIQELTFQAMQVMAATYVTIEVWLTVTLIYLIMCMTLSLGVQWLERRLARSEA